MLVICMNNPASKMWFPVNSFQYYFFQKLTLILLYTCGVLLTYKEKLGLVSHAVFKGLCHGPSP